MQRHQVRTSGGNIEIEQSEDKVNLNVPKNENELTRDEARQLGERLVNMSQGKGESGGQSGGSKSPTRSSDQA